jgi:hypothetical protein
VVDRQPGGVQRALVQLQPGRPPSSFLLIINTDLQNNYIKL